MDFDLSRITGYDLDYADLEVAFVNDFSPSSSDNTYIKIQNCLINQFGQNFWVENEILLYNGGGVNYINQKIKYVSGVLRLYQGSSNYN